MRELISSKKTLIISIIGVIGGFFWLYLSEINLEPIILIVTSFVEIIAYSTQKFIIQNSDKQEKAFSNKNNVNVNVNVGETVITKSKKTDDEYKVVVASGLDREDKIELMKTRINILFIDDDKNFNVVKILKDSGWRKTKSVVDVKNIDLPVIKDSQILFVDINGVGKLLQLNYEGLDLSLMIKERYPDKKVIIYSANRTTTNAFHKAWTICDFRLEKNALPNQFLSLVENYCLNY